jgi:ABC-type uncharacterized transport system involved in gliding motility auxiliary subunit
LKYGIQGFNLPTGEKTFLGLVALSADQEQTIPFLDPTREIHLEYDITRIVSQVQTDEKPKIGIMSALNAMGGASMNPMGMQQRAEPWLFTKELAKDYELVSITPDQTEIPENLDLLILHHPKNLPDSFLYAVDQFVLSGGRLVVLADAFAIMDQDRSPMKASVPKKLFDAWGVEMASDKIVADYGFSTRLRNRNNQIEENPLWVSVDSDAFNPDQIISAELNGILLPLPGGLKKVKDSPYDYVSLARSSNNAGLVDSFKVPMGIELIKKDFVPDKEPLDYVVSITGKFKTAFEEGRPKPNAETGKEKEETENPDKPVRPHLVEAKGENTILIFSDADFLYDAYYLNRQNLLGFEISQMFNDNLNLVQNAAEMLTGNKALISIRSRGRFDRPFTKVQALEQKAQAKWLAREQELVRKVEETNQALRELERGKDADQQVIISAQQEEEIQKFTEERNRIQKELKMVRRNLRADIEKLGTKVKFVNIFLMPLIVSLGGLVYALYRRKKSLSG